jgi:hypothetical protein
MTLRKTAHGEVLGTSSQVREALMQSTPSWSPDDEAALIDENMLPGPTDDVSVHTE